MLIMTNIKSLPAMLIVVALIVVTGCCGKKEPVLEQAGKAYLEGDYRKAVLMFMPEAEDGNPEAQVNIAFMYYCGMHVEKDHSVAAEWYKKAADRNNVTAQFSLATLFENGEGVNRDLEEAYFWYNLAEKQGDKDAQKLRRELEQRLSAAQISRVKSRLATWQPLQ
ncbi:MAG TPA: hypothetical protein DCG57_13540 [Candidatus Riflebacteria bacterium]|nr:hypothetical protein [Candidatus Riflebacteria bacterium]